MTNRAWLAAAIALILCCASDLALATDLDDARAFHREGDQLFGSGHFQNAIGAYEKALDLFERLSRASDAAVARHQLGFAHSALGEHDIALRYFEQNLALHQRRGDLMSSANYLQYAGQLYIETGNLDKAKKYLDQARQYLLSNPQRLAEVEHLRVVAHERLGNIDEAKAILTEARKVVDDETWNRHLADDAERLGIAGDRTATRDPMTARTFVLLGILATVTVMLIAMKLGFLGVRFKNFALFIVSALLTLLFSEFALRLILPEPPVVSHLLHAPNRVTRFVPSPGIMIGVDNKQTFFSTNNAGVRGDPVPEEDSTPRILVIGGSSTEGLFLDDPDAWPHVLQTLLTESFSKPVWVGNAGKSGLNSFGHVVQFHYYQSELRPNVVILQAGINDLNSCISGGMAAMRDSARMIRQPGFFEDYGKFVFHEIRPAQMNSSWRLVDLFRRAKRALFEPAASGPVVPLDFVVQDQAAEFYNEQRRRRQVARKEQRIPDIGECLAAYRFNLDSIANIARESGIALMLLTQGSLYRTNLTPSEENLLWFGSVDANPFSQNPPNTYYSASVLNTLLDQYNQQSLNVCAAGGAHCLDVATALPRTTGIYYDDVHLNVNGAKALARAVADELQRVKLLPH